MVAALGVVMYPCGHAAGRRREQGDNHRSFHGHSGGLNNSAPTLFKDKQAKDQCNVRR